MQHLPASRSRSHSLNQDATDVAFGGRFERQAAFTGRTAAKRFASMNVRCGCGVEMGLEHPPMTGYAI